MQFLTNDSIVLHITFSSYSTTHKNFISLLKMISAWTESWGHGDAPPILGGNKGAFIFPNISQVLSHCLPFSRVRYT